MKSEDILIKGGRELGLNIDLKMVDKFMKFKDILIEWNKKINLTGITDEYGIMTKHFLDSLTCLLTGVIKPDSKIIDVGTGAGFPGVPLKIYYEDLELTLLDSLNKRINYLKVLCEETHLRGIEFIHGRAEEYGKNENHREVYDVAVARAVAELRVLGEYCLPFIKEDGYFIAQKGNNIDEEIEKSSHAIKILGGKIVDIKSVKIPFTDIEHSLIVIKKISKTPKKYPRKPGKPNKNPLG